MSWLFSQALVAEYSAGTCSDGEPCAPLSGSPTPQAFLPSDKMTAFSRPSRFGMTFAPLTDTRGAELLTWFREASHARTSALPAKAQALTVPAAECGEAWRGSWARFDPASSSWRTAQPCLLGDSDESLVTWPRSGMTAGGQCWELPTLARPTAANDSGLLPTPLASNTKAHHMRSGGRPARSYIPTPIATEWKNGCGKTGNRAPEKAAKAGMKLGEYAKLWPTPTSSLGTNGGQVTPTKAREGGTLIEALSARTTWPTPTVCGNYNRKGASATSGDGLATAVLKVATPTARDWRSGKASQATHDKNSRPLSEQIGGSLNPTWVEWLMGWPLGWTDLKPLETAKCPDAQPQLSAC